jgi:hypothetical protein
VTAIIRCLLFLANEYARGGVSVNRLTTSVKKSLTIYQQYDIFNRQISRTAV